MKHTDVTAQPCEVALPMSSWTVRAALEITQAIAIAVLPRSGRAHAGQDSNP
jgi:hypothetical protein